MLGIVFLSIQGYEYARLGFTPRNDAYGLPFCTITTITAFDGLHVVGGLLVNLYLQAQAWMRLVGR